MSYASRSSLPIVCGLLVASFCVPAAAVVVETGTISSFDAVSITYSLFIPPGADAANRAPVVFMTHGWGGSRVTDPANERVKMLTDAGYAVLTWDQRGFGVSGGEANVDSQEFEVRDVQALIDLVAEDPRILLDDDADPRMGMLGGSYAGGIQLMTAAADERVDAIVPEIAWHDLPQSLKPNGVLKLGWDLLLYGAGLASAASAGLPAGQTGAYNAHIHQSLVEGMALNDWSTTTYDWFDAKSPKHYIGGASLPGGRELPGISAPTLLIQGVSDTLFPVNEALGNYEAIRARGVPAKMIWFCGGHTITPLGTSCVRGADQGAVLNARIMAWLDRYVKGDVAVETGPALEYQLQDGSWHALESLPGDTIDISEPAKVTNYIVPTSGQGTAATPAGCVPKEGTASIDSSPRVWARETAEHMQKCPASTGAWLPVGTFTGPPGPKGCVPAFDPEHPEKPICTPTFEHVPAGTHILGAPRLTLRLSSTASEAYLFFKLIDYERETNRAVVIDDQAMAFRASWPGALSQGVYELQMAAVAWEVSAGHEIYIEVSATSNDHASSRAVGNHSMVVDARIPIVPAP